MKRMIARLLLCCLMLAAPLPAGAAAAPLRYAGAAQDLFTDWLEANHPDIAWEVDLGPDSTQEALQALESGDGPDLLMVESARVDLQALLQSGLVEDLSGNQEILLGLAQMYQPFQDMVTGADGAVYGAPYAVFNLTMHVIPSSWEAAGLSLEEAPQSVEELLDFALRWADLAQAGAVNNVRLHTLEACGYPEDDRRYTLWLTDLVTQCWTMQAQEAGKPVIYDDPEFIALADRARTAGQNLAAAEEQPDAASLSLYDAGMHRGMGYGAEALDENAFPLRIHAEDPFRTQGYCWLFVVRKGSAYAEECAEFLGDLIHQTDDGQRRNVKLYKEIPEHQFTATPSEDGYVFTPEWQASYRPEQLFFSYDPFHTTTAYMEREDLLLRFAQGSITAQELALGLDQALAGN